MAIFNKYNSGAKALCEGINSGSDVWKIALTNTAPSTSHTILSEIAELPTSGGYTSGGGTCAIVSSSQSAGIYKLVLSNPPTWTAAGSGFTFRYCVLYSATSGNQLVGYWDNGSSITLNSTDTFTVNLDSSNGVFIVN